jgi:hypothetical protein
MALYINPQAIRCQHLFYLPAGPGSPTNNHFAVDYRCIARWTRVSADFRSLLAIDFCGK